MWMLTIVPSYTKMEVPLEFLILPHLLSPPSVIGIPMRVPLLKKKKKKPPKSKSLKITCAYTSKQFLYRIISEQ